MSSSSSSSDRSHEGGAKLVPQPRRKPSGIVKAPPPAPIREPSHKKSQTTQIKNPDSPTPLGKGQRTAERGALQPPNPYYYQAPLQVRNIGYPSIPGNSSLGLPSETSASSGYFPNVRLPQGYGTYISPHGGHHMVLSSTSSAPPSSVDVVTTGLRGLKLREYQQVSCP